ncbi:MAG: DUF1385 domain-containing protein [Clostridia bacterium]|nr:DUF1385 domain-containing protein [Clostridia bacterium]
MASQKVNVGGQAVIEGVMMRGPKKYAVAIRKTNGNVLLDKGDVNSITDRVKFLKIFLIRGIVAFFESITLGMKTLLFSADYFDTEEKSSEDAGLYSAEEMKVVEERETKEKIHGWIVFTSLLVSLLICITLFFILPTYVAGLFFNNVDTDQRIWFNLVEGALRILIFFAYLLLVSNMKDIRRVFEYHGAEHKTINCFEAGEELTIENVKKHSRFHPRCGTSFIFVVMIVSIIVFAFFKADNIWLTILQRILLLPVVAGVSYEVIRFFGKFRGKIGRAFAMPAMWFQCFTTREPDDVQIFIAITALKTAIEEL